jgi:hypothetical protein
VRITIWSHFAPTGGAAASQRTSALAAQLTSRGHDVIFAGGRFDRPDRSRYDSLTEMLVAATSKADLHIVSVPPYRSALPFLLGTRLARVPLLLDQRDLALVGPRDMRIERFAVNGARAVLVTTRAQQRALHQRYPGARTILLRNGTSLERPSPQAPEGHSSTRLRVGYQGIVGGKSLERIAASVAAAGCDFVLAVFDDASSRSTIQRLRSAWPGPGRLSIHTNLSGAALSVVMSGIDVAVNPVPQLMDYAMTVKTADYAILGVPQLVIGSRRSLTRRTVERCRLGIGIDDPDRLTRAHIEKARTASMRSSTDRLRVFRRDYQLEKFFARHDHVMSALPGPCASV